MPRTHFATRWALLLVLGLLTSGIGLAEAEGEPGSLPAQCPPLCVGPAPDPGPVAAPLIPIIEWEMLPRYDASWDAWVEPEQELLPIGWVEVGEGHYAPDFVNPDGWGVVFNGCSSISDAEAIVQYAWTVAGMGRVQTYATSECRFEGGLPSSPIHLPAEGTYTVALTVTTAAERSESTSQVIEINDLVVLSIGDSAASGEGNPDDGEWVNQRCHRSRTSGHAFAAAAMEEADPHTSVTFLSFACSGARVPTILGPYAGKDPPHWNQTADGQLVPRFELPPQLDAAADLLCISTAPCAPDQRRGIDRLLISVGVNDLGLSSLIVSCAIPLALDCDKLQANHDKISQGLNELTFGTSGSYAAIQERVEDLGLRVAETYVTEYPAHPFRDDEGPEGCGVLDGIHDGEAAWLHANGDRLNLVIRNAAIRSGWHSVSGITEAFENHGYCTSAGVLDYDPVTDTGTYFRGLVDSFLTQGDKDGAVHPNRPGHQAIAELIADAFAAPKPDRAPVWRARVTVEQIRVFDSGVSGLLLEDPADPTEDPDAFVGGDQVLTENEVAVRLSARVAPVESGVVKDGALAVWTTQLPRGEWVPVPPELFTFTVDLAPVDELHILFQTPLPQLPQGTLDMPRPPLLRSILAEQTFPAPAFGEGAWTARSTDDMGYFEITYRIEVETIGFVGGTQVVAAIAPDASIDVPLVAGWNLVGWTGPTVPVTEVVPQVPGAAALEWDALARTFRSYRRDLPTGLNSLTEARFGAGLWLYTPVAQVWEQPALGFGNSVVLQPGYNLVVWTGPEAMAVEAAITGVPGIRTVTGWDAHSKRFWSYSRDLPPTFNTLSQLSHGAAFWVFADRTTTWQHPDSRPLARIDTSAGEFLGGGDVVAR